LICFAVKGLAMAKNIPTARLWVGAALAGLALTACGPAEKKEAAVKAPTTPSEIVEAAADPCTTVSGAYGKWLCGDPELAPLMTQVKANLVEAAGALSAPSAQQLGTGQKEWVEAVRVECGIGTGDVPLTAEQEECVRGQLTSRIKEAQEAVLREGGFTFQTIEVNRAAPIAAQIAADNGLGDDAPPVTQEIKYPRIEGDSPQIKRFNELMIQRAKYGLADATSETVSYAISFAGPELVSVRFDMYEYSAGAAHPSNSSKAVSVVMKTGELLTAADVFSAPEARWKATIATRALRDITKQLRAVSPELRADRGEVADTATKTQNWLITEKDLVILFPPYSFGAPHAAGGLEVKIPWTELAPMLNAQAPAPIRRTQG
jgi:hypothetical protein